MLSTATATAASISKSSGALLPAASVRARRCNCPKICLVLLLLGQPPFRSHSNVKVNILWCIAMAAEVATITSLYASLLHPCMPLSCFGPLIHLFPKEQPSSPSDYAGHKRARSLKHTLLDLEFAAKTWRSCILNKMSN